MEENNKTSKGSRLRAIEVLYQPVFDIHLNMAIDYEVSLRINDRQVGVILPATFIPVAEKTNQICEIGKWMLGECCDAIIRCAKREADINSVILPTSVRHLAKPYFVDQAIKTVEKKEVNPDKICFNIGESILEDTKESVFKNINALRDYGFMVSIDDFGVEHTSMTRLSQYEVDYIGLNEVMIDGIMESERTQNAVQGIIEFAKKIETKVKIDGIDSEEKAELLRKLGADRLKGSLYGKPILEKQIKIV